MGVSSEGRGGAADDQALREPEALRPGGAALRDAAAARPARGRAARTSGCSISATALDLTNLTLAQALLESVRQGASRIPRQVLTRLIRIAAGPATGWGEWPEPEEAAGRARQETERLVSRLLGTGRLSLDDAVALRRDLGRARPPAGERRPDGRRGPPARPAVAGRGSGRALARRPARPARGLHRQAAQGQEAQAPGASAPGPSAPGSEEKTHGSQEEGRSQAGRAHAHGPAGSRRRGTTRGAALRSAEATVGSRVAALVERSGLEPREVMRQAEAVALAPRPRGQEGQEAGRGAPGRAAAARQARPPHAQPQRGRRGGPGARRAQHPDAPRGPAAAAPRRGAEGAGRAPAALGRIPRGA